MQHSESPKISVIIPVYNVEKVLPRCLDSLLGQTFVNWEALCIDDGSSDGSGGVLDEYARKDPRFRVRHKSNAGVSEARNEALGIASGEYLLFVDSDDFLHPQTMEICLYMAERDASDLVAFTYNRRFRTALTLRHFLGLPEPGRIKFRNYACGNIESVVTDDIFTMATEYSHPEGKEMKRWAVKHCQPWRCLYRAERIRHIRFIPGIIYEDFPWWIEVMLNVRRATIINLPLYYYYPNFSGYIHSAAQQFRISSLRTAIDAVQTLCREKLTPAQSGNCTRNFLVPFREKLEKKVKAVERSRGGGGAHGHGKE